MPARGSSALLVIIALAIGAFACSSGSAKSPGPLVPADQPECQESGSESFAEHACFTMDMDPDTPGYQQTRIVKPGDTFGVEVWVRGVPPQPGLGAFVIVLTYDKSWLRAADPRPGPAVRDLINQRLWDCSAPAPTAALPDGDAQGDDNPATSDAYIGCFQSTQSDAPGPSGDILVAKMFFTATAKGRSKLTLLNADASLNAVGAPLVVDCAVSDPHLAATRCLGGEVEAR